MAEHLTEASASKFAEPMFERQFPQCIEQSPAGGLAQLDHLPRR
jgi:hypothetical protein